MPSRATCLNLSNAENKKFVAAYGVAGTYQIYVQHGYWMPQFDAYQLHKETDVLPTAQAMTYLQSMVNMRQFNVAALDAIGVAVPNTTEAAFYKDAFYFGKEITRGALSEEIFHAVFQRLIPVQHRAALLKTGQQLLRTHLAAKGFTSIQQYYAYQKQALPQTYGKLSEEAAMERLYEEALATEYVRYTTYGRLKQQGYHADVTARLAPHVGAKAAGIVQDLVDLLFKALTALRNLFLDNRTAAELFYSKINSGQFQTARIVEAGATQTVPTTRLIAIKEGKETLSPNESAQLVRSVGALVIELRKKEEVGHLSNAELLTKALEAFAVDYGKQGGKGSYISDAMQPTTVNDDLDEIDNAEYAAIRADVEQYLRGMRVVTDIRNEADQDDVGSGDNQTWDKEANESGGYASMSTWNKQYIALTGKVRTIDGVIQYHTIQVQLVDAAGETTTKNVELPIVDIVDPDRVFYGLARAIGNTKDLEKRLQKLLLYTSFSGADNTSAFADQLLRDMAPIIYRPKAEIKQLKWPVSVNTPAKALKLLQKAHPNADTEALRTQATQLFTKHQETNPVIVRDQLQQAIATGTLDTYLSPTAKQILTKSLKGFDLWSRTMMVQLVDPANGLSQTINANQNRASKNLFNKWAQSYLDNNVRAAEEDPNYVAGEVAQRALKYSQKGETEAGFSRQPLPYQVERLNASIANQSAEIRRVFARLGITLADAYVQQSIISLALKNNLLLRPALEQTKAYQLVSLFTTDAGKELEQEDIRFAQLYIKSRGKNPFIKLSEAQEAQLKELGGMHGKLTRLSEGSAVFDENAFESNYVNATNKTIFTHQNKTYSLAMFDTFAEKDLSTLLNLHKTGNRTLMRKDADGNNVYIKEDAWTLTENTLLSELASNVDYRKYHSLFAAFTVDGMQQTQLVRTGKNNRTFSPKGAVSGLGVTYGDMSDREFSLFNLNSLSTSNTLTKVVERAAGGTMTIAPVFLGNRETSKTGEYLMLPLLEDLHVNGRLTARGTELFLNEVRKEYARIGNVYNALQITEVNGKVTSTLKDSTQDEFTNYHTGSKLVKVAGEINGAIVPVYVPTANKDYRGLQFSDTVAGLLGEATALKNATDPNGLIVSAMLGKPFPVAEMTKLLQENISSTLQEHFDNFTAQGIWDNKTDAGTTLLDRSITKEAIQTKLLSDVINNIAVAQIVYGDAALLYKNDGIDVFKRLKGLNAAIVSFAIPFAAPELGIDVAPDYYRVITVAEPKAVSDVTEDGKATGSIDLADAQGYDSVQARRISQYGQGNLTTFLASILDDIEAGKPVTGKRLAALRESGIMFNSEKTVGATGQYYKKLSTTMLSRELTSDSIDLFSMLSDKDALEAFQEYGDVDDYGRTVLKPGSPDVTTYVNGKGKRVYKLWVAKGDPTLHELRLRMAGFEHNGTEWVFRSLQNRVHLVTPLTGSKTLNPNVHKDVSGQTINSRTIQDKAVHFVDLNYYGLQTANPSGKTKIVDPTQMLEIINNEQDGRLEVWHNGALISKTAMDTLWQEYLSARDMVNYNVAANVFKNEAGEEDLSEFRESAFRSMLASGKDKQTVALMEPNSGYNPNLPMTRDQWISAFFSHFSKEVLAHKRAGDALAHVSSLGHQGVKRVYRLPNGQLTWDYIRTGSVEYQTLLRDKKIQGLPSLRDLRYKHTFVETYKNGKVISKALDQRNEFKDEEGKGYESWFGAANKLLDASFDEDGNKLDYVYVLDSLRHLKPRWETINGKLENTGFFSEVMMPVHDDQIKDLTAALRYAFGVRIPSQDKHSAINTEWVDTMPAFMGSSVIAPKEIVELSGSDFDIDKLYLTRAEGFWQDGVFVAYGTAATDAERWIEMQKYVLSHYKPVKRLFKTLLDNAEYKDLKAALALEAKESRGQLTFVDPEETSEAVLDLYLEGNFADYTKAVQVQYNAAIAKAFTRYGLPGTEKEFVKDPNSSTLNVGAMHNAMLNLQQQQLANNYTLDDNDGGQANQPAALTKLTELKDFTYKGVKLFGETTDKVSSHWLLTHSRVHKKNQVGKALIGIAVNANLFIINAVKLGFTVHEAYAPSLLLPGGRKCGGQYVTLIKNPDGTTTRVFDVNSTIITANTDEAKEGLNAFFNLSTDAQAAVMHMNGLGYSLLDALTFVNQPIIQAYITKTEQNKNAKAGKGVITAEETKLKYSDKEAIAREVLGLNPNQVLRKSDYTTEDLQESLYVARTGNGALENQSQLDQSVLLDFMNLVAINDYAAHYVRFIKLKKGFGQDLESFDRLQESADVLGFRGDAEEKGEPIIDIKDKMEAQPELARQILQTLEPVTGILDRNLVQQIPVIFRRSDAFQRVAQQLLGSGDVNDPRAKPLDAFGADEREKINRAVETFIFTKLYKQLFEPGKALAGQTAPDLAAVYADGGEQQLAYQLQQFKELYAYNRINETTLLPEKGIFADNPILEMLTSEVKNGVNVVKLNTIVKLRPEQQEGLLDAFKDLYLHKNQPFVDGVSVGETLAIGLLNYFIAKDGFQFTMGNISKLFSPEAFGQISQAITDFQQNGAEGTQTWGAELLTSLGRDVNFQSFIPSLKAVKEGPRVAQAFDADGNYSKNVLDTGIEIAYPTDLTPEAAGAAIRAAGLMEGPQGTIQFPRFLKREITDTEGIRQTRVYELVDVEGPRMYTLQTLLQATVVSGKIGRYAAVVSAGSADVAAATGLGQHYTPKAVENLQKRTQYKDELLSSYYAQILDTRVLPVEELSEVEQTGDFLPDAYMEEPEPVASAAFAEKPLTAAEEQVLDTLLDIAPPDTFEQYEAVMDDRSFDGDTFDYSPDEIAAFINPYVTQQSDNDLTVRPDC